MKKILITGSNGLLGQKLVYALIERDDVELIATARGVNRLKEQLGYTYECMDVSNSKQVEMVIGKYHPDCIIHTAAITNIDPCETKRELCWRSNVSAVEYLVRECEKYGIHFIHLSTDFVFDGEKGDRYTEEDLPNPVSYYGLSKLEAEKVVQASDCPWAIIRTILVYGIVDDMSRSNIVLWAKGALEKGDPINVVDDQFRSPTLAEDLAQGCILTAMKEAKGIYNISGMDHMSIIDLVYQVANYYKLDKSLINPVSSKTLDQPAKRPPRTGFFLEKAMNELGYRPHSFKEGIAILDRQVKEMSN